MSHNNKGDQRNATDSCFFLMKQEAWKQAFQVSSDDKDKDELATAPWGISPFYKKQNKRKNQKDKSLSQLNFFF